jgi:hypothetical protein
MHKLITLGCSITHQAGWADYLRQCMDVELINLAQSAGSNDLQQRRFQEYVFKNNIDTNTIIIWQITTPSRFYNRVFLTEIIEKEIKNATNIPKAVYSNKNLFDNFSRVDMLCTAKPPEYNKDEYQALEDLLFYLIVARKMTPNLLIIFGWEQAMDPAVFEKFKSVLTEHNIEYINDPIIEWCLKNNLPFNPSLHPTIGSSSIFAKDIIIPKLEKMLSINITPVTIWAK